MFLPQLLHNFCYSPARQDSLWHMVKDTFIRFTAQVWACCASKAVLALALRVRGPGSPLLLALSSYCWTWPHARRSCTWPPPFAAASSGPRQAPVPASHALPATPLCSSPVPSRCPLDSSRSCCGCCWLQVQLEPEQLPARSLVVLGGADELLGACTHGPACQASGSGVVAQG
jgi:hypothetical protein